MQDIRIMLEQTIYSVLSPRLVAAIRNVSPSIITNTAEIRLRINQPLIMVMADMDIMLTASGQPAKDRLEALICTSEDLSKTLQLMSKNSLYAFEQEMRMGFLTVKGGHRIGLAGQIVVDDGKIKTLKNISSMNIRLAREVKGCADKIIPFIIAGKNKILSTLLISPPRCGKTTVLRDLIRHVSIGSLNFMGVQVGLVDERSEVAACQHGIPSVDLGYRVDVLDGCSKANGMLMLIRSMAPQVVATDELGREEDAYAVCEALHAGVSVIATVHGQDVNDVLQRPYIGDLIKHQYFERYVILGDHPIPGTVKEIIAVKSGKTLYKHQDEVKICG